MKRRGAFFLCIVLCLLAGLAFADTPVLKMATTTSTDNTGLLDYLAPLFMRDTSIELQWVSVGTGKALEYGRNGDVDVVLVHDPEAEEKFVSDGSGVNRRRIMYNDFVVVGPASDPAKVAGLSTAEAMKKIAGHKAVFASRADKSGTHSAELAQWKHAGIAAPDKEKWYVQTGQGMLETLNVAEQSDGYCLTDRGTYIKYESNSKGKTPLVILVEGDVSLRNQYSVIAVNPSKHTGIQYDLALKLTDWLRAPETQQAIADFRLEGKQLFFPNAER